MGRYAYKFFRNRADPNPNMDQCIDEYFRVRNILVNAAESSERIKSLFNDPEEYADAALRYYNNVYIYTVINVELAIYEKLELDALKYTNISTSSGNNNNNRFNNPEN